MAIISITEAAKLVGESRQTIINYIKQGKLSKITDPTSKIEGIDTSELARVYGSLSTAKNKKIDSDIDSKTGHDLTGKLKPELDRLKLENEYLKKALDDQKELVKEYRNLLVYKPAKKNGFFTRLFGRGKKKE